jgi:hypothetical protein
VFELEAAVKCQLCKQRVFTVAAANKGSDLVLDEKPDPEGYVWLETAKNAAVKRGHFIRRDEHVPEDQRYMLHRDTCTKADRRARRKPVGAEDEEHRELWSPVKEA